MNIIHLIVYRLVNSCEIQPTNNNVCPVCNENKKMHDEHLILKCEKYNEYCENTIILVFLA